MLGSVTANEKDRLAVLTFFFRYFPTQLDFVTTQLDAFRQARLQVGVAGSLALIWASLGVFGAITSAVNEAWGVEKQRSFLKHRPVSFLMLVATGGVMMIALILVSFVQVVEARWFGSMVARFQWMQAAQTLTFQYSATILLIFAVGLVFYFRPRSTGALAGSPSRCRSAAAGGADDERAIGRGAHSATRADLRWEVSCRRRPTRSAFPQLVSNGRPASSRIVTSRSARE